MHSAIAIHTAAIHGVPQEAEKTLRLATGEDPDDLEDRMLVETAETLAERLARRS